MTSSAPSRFLASAFIAMVLAPVVAEVVTTDIFIVREGDPIAEDVYVAAQSGTVEGRVDGDLTIVTGDLTISGVVTGSVTALSSADVTVTATGRIEGSLRAVARQVVVAGAVGGDVLSTSISTRIDEGGTVGRDVIAFGATLAVHGEVGRDIRGRVFDVSVTGSVGNDLDVTVSRLSVGDGAVIGGDVLYRSAGEAAIDPGATITGQVVRLPSSPNFLYGVILTVANIVSLLAFVVIGLATFWLARRTSARAVAVALRRPLQSFLIGLLAIVLGPILVVLFAVTLVGIPLALALVVLLLLALVVGPLPIVTAVADRALRSRGGLFGAFLLGAVVWRLGIWFIPWVGGFLYLAGLVWGTGAWLVGAWEERKSTGPSPDLLPPAMRLDDDLPDDWDFPLPPLPTAAAVSPEGPSAEVDEEPVTAEERAGGPPDLAARMSALTGEPVVETTAPVDVPEDLDGEAPPPSPPPVVEPTPPPTDHHGGDEGGGDEWGLPRR